MATALVVDDDPLVARIVQEALAGQHIEVLCVHSIQEGEAAVRRCLPDVLLLDVVFPEGRGMELAHCVRQLDEGLPIVFVTAADDSDSAIEAMKLGAYDYLLKPLDLEQVRGVTCRALEASSLARAVVASGRPEKPREAGAVLIGRSPQMLTVYKQIGRVAAEDVAVLISGESGTGKELVARAIYQHSHRADKAFLAVNCAALSDTLLESELFGHEKGAFTGADHRHIGKFEQCDGGTIFLDEVGDMSPSTQSKVLRLLQEQKFERVGGTETIETDVRLISATNCDLGQMIHESRFRLDLYHRLNAFEIALPPLRERGDDADELIDYWLWRLNQQFNKSVTEIAPPAMELLKRYPWPGNVRELQSVLRKAVLLATGPVILPEFLPTEIHAYRPGVAPSAGSAEAADFLYFLRDREAADSNALYAECLQWMERRLLSRVLETYDGNQSRAAERLGITRGSLRHKLRSLNLAFDVVITSR
jgi:DNA-binding NtrC family response regulator